MTTTTRLVRLEKRQKAGSNRGSVKYRGPFGHLPIFARLWEGAGDEIWIRIAQSIANALVEKGRLPQGFQHLPHHFLCRWARLTGARIRAHDQRDDATEQEANEGLRLLSAEIRAFATTHMTADAEQVENVI